MVEPVKDVTIPLEKTLSDEPQIHSLVDAYSADISTLHNYMKTLHHLTSQIVTAHNQVNASYQDLARHLSAYKSQRFITEVDPSGVMQSNISKLSSSVSEMSSWEQIIATQIADGAVYPLAHFISVDLMDLQTMASVYQSANADVDRALLRYSKSKEKDGPLEFQEASKDVYSCRKKYHQVALQFYAALNLLQLKRKSAILGPVYALLDACRTNLRLAQDTFSQEATTGFMNNIAAAVKCLNGDIEKQYCSDTQQIETIIEQCQYMYAPEPPKELQITPSQNASEKAGYLNVHRKYMGLMSTWERQFVYIDKGNIMAVPKGAMGATVLVELDMSTIAHATDTDDRRFVFQVNTSKKSVILQALNCHERDEWMLAIQNAAKSVESPTVETPKPSSLLTDVGQYLSGKLHSVRLKDIGPASPSSVPPDVVPISGDVPIMFDLKSAALVGENKSYENVSQIDASSKERKFVMRFLGCMAVNVKSGEKVVFEVIHQILVARAVHDLFSTNEVLVAVDDSRVAVVDNASKELFLAHSLSNVTHWTAHSENPKLLGYIVKSGLPLSEGSTFTCFVFESDRGGAEFCQTLTEAASRASQEASLTQRRQETDLLLANIATLPDKETSSTSSSSSTEVEDASHAVSKAESGD